MGAGVAKNAKTRLIEGKAVRIFRLATATALLLLGVGIGLPGTLRRIVFMFVLLVGTERTTTRTRIRTRGQEDKGKDVDVTGDARELGPANSVNNPTNPSDSRLPHPSVSAVSAVVNRNITHPDNCRGGGGGGCGSDGGGDDDEMSSNPL